MEVATVGDDRGLQMVVEVAKNNKESTKGKKGDIL